MNYREVIETFDTQVKREKMDRINCQNGKYNQRRYVEDSYIRKEIFELSYKMSVDDFRKMRNDMFPDYYEKKGKLRGIEKLIYKRNCLRAYLGVRK